MSGISMTRKINIKRVLIMDDMAGRAHLKNEMLQLGADWFIEKPFDLLEIKNLLENVKSGY